MNKKEQLLKKLNILVKMQENQENMIKIMIEEQKKPENKDIINPVFEDRRKRN